MFGPIACEVDVHSGPQQAIRSAMLEQHVPNFVWSSFVTSDDRDRDFLQGQLKRYNSNVINYSSDSSKKPTTSRVDNKRLAELGVQTTLDQVSSSFQDAMLSRT